VVRVRPTRSSFASSIRLALLLVATLVAPLIGTDDPETLRYLVAVIVVALVGTTLSDQHRLKLPVLVLEALLAAGGVVLTADPSLPLLICLPSTTIAAGLAGGYLGTVLTGGTAAAVLLLGRVLRSDDPAAAAYSASAAQWVLVAVLSGVLAARIHSLSAATSPMDRYARGAGGCCRSCGRSRAGSRAASTRARSRRRS
jgi:hypothetical protein